MKRTAGSLHGQRAIPKSLAAVVDLLSLWIGGSSVLGANVGSKLFVTLVPVLLLHFVQ
jgi:hypothetical protein